jgi:hypothetical protein
MTNDEAAMTNEAVATDILSDWPIQRPRNWVALVNEPMTKKELEGFRVCLARNRRYGNDTWQIQQARRLELLHTLRGEGRPKSVEPKNYLRPRFKPNSNLRPDPNKLAEAWA